MTNHLTHRFGRSRRATARSPGSRGGTGALLATLGLLVSALPALAAEIVEVRVGRHPTFTRVVFELDRPAGYRIERTDPSNGTAELVVSLEAASVPRSVEGNKRSLIRHVDVEPEGRRSIARVKLTEGGLRLKEMILASPPRIVLDVLNDEPATPVAKAPKSAPKAAAKPRASADDGFDAVVADLEGKSTSAKPQPAPKVVARPEPKPAPKVVARPEPKPAPKVVARPEPKPAPKVVVKPEPEPAPVEVARNEPEPAPMAPVEPADDRVAMDESSAGDDSLFGNDPQDAIAGADEPSTSVPVEPEETAVADTPPTPQMPVAPAPKRVPPPMVARSTTPEDEGGGWMTMALVGVGALVLLVGGGLFLAKRRSGGDVDDDAWDDEATEPNPFGSTGESTLLGGPDDETVVAGMSMDEETTQVSVSDEEKESESIFGDSEEKDMDDMEVISRDQVNESLGGPAMPPAVGGVSDDVQAMFAEMTRRMEALESRCDELVDARDRLERQVAAQTEELRVQRAAIARTQRAVRNLGRGEGEGEAPDEATEPALRDPNQ